MLSEAIASNDWRAQRFSESPAAARWIAGGINSFINGENAGEFQEREISRQSFNDGFPSRIFSLGNTAFHLREVVFYVGQSCGSFRTGQRVMPASGTWSWRAPFRAEGLPIEWFFFRTGTMTSFFLATLISESRRGSCSLNRIIGSSWYGWSLGRILNTTYAAGLVSLSISLNPGILGFPAVPLHLKTMLAYESTAISISM